MTVEVSLQRLCPRLDGSRMPVGAIAVLATKAER